MVDEAVRIEALVREVPGPKAWAEIGARHGRLRDGFDVVEQVIHARVLKLWEAQPDRQEGRRRLGEPLLAPGRRQGGTRCLLEDCGKTRFEAFASMERNAAVGGTRRNALPGRARSLRKEAAALEAELTAEARAEGALLLAKVRSPMNCWRAIMTQQRFQNGRQVGNYYRLWPSESTRATRAAAWAPAPADAAEGQGRRTGGRDPRPCGGFSLTR